MKPEQLMWRKLKTDLWGSGIHMTRHEDMLSKGIPDVSYGFEGTQGWIELKQVRFWPKLAETVIQVDHFSKEQKAWLISRGSVGNNCWVVLKVDKDWLLFDYINCVFIGKTTKANLMSKAVFVWKDRVDKYKFTSILKRGCSNV